MSDETIAQVDIESWVSSASDDVAEHTVRRVMRVILHAIADNPCLNSRMVMKGGVLLSLRYSTGRHTRDIDFSSEKPAQEENCDEILENLREALTRSRTRDQSVLCRIQSYKMQPPKETARFPTLRVNIGYAIEGEKQFKRMVQGQPSTRVVVVDLSFNERTCYPTEISLDNGRLKAYSLHDQIAEKYRALIQQTSDRRNRVRRQDAYDIFAVIRNGYLSERRDREMLMAAMRQKFSDRNVPLNPQVINEPEIEERCRREYKHLADEIDGELPEFDLVFSTVRDFFGGLPWDD